MAVTETMSMNVAGEAQRSLDETAGVASNGWPLSTAYLVQRTISNPGLGA